MSPRYLLPCDCGQSIPIEPSQAGQTVACMCGRSQQAPTMRGIRQLPVAPDEAAQSPRAASWNPLQGAMFATGAVLLIIGLIVAAYNYRPYTQLSEVKPSAQVYAAELEHIDHETPARLLELWDYVTKYGLGEHESSIYVQARTGARNYRNLMMFGGALAVVGVVLSGLSLFVRSRPARLTP